MRRRRRFYATRRAINVCATDIISASIIENDIMPAIAIAASVADIHAYLISSASLMRGGEARPANSLHHAERAHVVDARYSWRR